MIVPKKPSPVRLSPGAASARAGASQQSLVGFLTVVEHPDVGFLGGYLILNSAARPVEFHCSAPLKANRAQEILYGATLRPYLCGELIGATLLAKAKNRAALVCTDCASVMTARGVISIPMVLIGNAEAGEPKPPPFQHSGNVETFEFADQIFAVSVEFLADRSAAAARLQTMGDGFDLTEPFERIRLAMDEAQRGAQR